MQAKVLQAMREATIKGMSFIKNKHGDVVLTLTYSKIKGFNFYKDIYTRVTFKVLELLKTHKVAI